MVLAEKIAFVQTLLGNDEAATKALITAYLSVAEGDILTRLYPLGAPSGATTPAMYDILQCKLAQRYFLRRGAEGETVHEENGINRSYGSANDEDLLKQIVPFAKVV